MAMANTIQPTTRQAPRKLPKYYSPATDPQDSWGRPTPGPTSQRCSASHPGMEGWNMSPRTLLPSWLSQRKKQSSTGEASDLLPPGRDAAPSASRSLALHLCKKPHFCTQSPSEGSRKHLRRVIGPVCIQECRRQANARVNKGHLVTTTTLGSASDGISGAAELAVSPRSLLTPGAQV